MGIEITFNLQKLTSDMEYLTDEHLRRAVAAIDAILGKGFAKKHPDLLLAYMRTAAENQSAAILAAVLKDCFGGIADDTHSIAESIAKYFRQQQRSQVE